KAIVCRASAGSAPALVDRKKRVTFEAKSWKSTMHRKETARPLFLRIRSFASPVQMLNYHTSFCMQAMGKGKETMLHAFVRELFLYIPFMFILDRAFGETGLAAALPVAEACAAVFALWLLSRTIRRSKSQTA
ncbi:MAG: polysaccharide biosynthesis C-terminal domain-containing protein, partial [Erysipelotrichaceae bacterium]|nr:polysaccharide biosynthesis C-terminal domain-containing protein [Erysipelotrichaceae bacterium]